MRMPMINRSFYIPVLLVGTVLADRAAAQEAYVISDFEDGKAGTAIYSSPGWVFVSDIDSHGNSQILSGDTLAMPANVDSNSFGPGYGGSLHSFKMEYKFGTIRPHGDAPDTSSYDPEVGFQANLYSDTGSFVDFTGATKITFWAKAAKATTASFLVMTPEILDYSYYRSDIAVTTAWKQFTVELKASKTFAQPEWSTSKQPFDIAKVQGLEFNLSQAFNPGTGGTLYLDDVTIHGWKPTLAPVDHISIGNPIASGSLRGMGRVGAGGIFKVRVPEILRQAAGKVEVYGTDGRGLARAGFQAGTAEVRVPLRSNSQERIFYRLGAVK